ncbi:hypothetical protein [Ruminiclostridium cellobioparum]|uniref:hypothetical protein n=1 Tax=Ruminiclostridium cellobioparum TaxID=29355 RepID=UPI000B249C55|nr:hypothetical protein [Ruminiclostridium cellobioparum]
MEFFEFLSPKHDIKATRIGFILQGGFEEAHQLRTAEHYLERLPCYLNCQYIGTLIKGGMFVLSLSSEKAKKTMLQPFFEIGRDFANTRVFNKEKVSAFAAPENYLKSLILLSTTASVCLEQTKMMSQSSGTPLVEKYYSFLYYF